MSSSNSGSDGQAEDARKNGELGESGLAMEGLRIAREVPPDKSSAPAAAVGSQARKARLAEFKKELAREVIDMQQLRKLCFQGCPEEEGIRATCWKLLLGYLPPGVADWNSALEMQRTSYLKLRREILISPHESEDGSAGEMVDHPLNPDPTSTWHRYFEDNEVLLQIDFDARRLYPDMSFFQLATPYPQAEYKTGTVLNIDALKSRVDRTTLTTHQVAMSRGGVRNMKSSRKRSVDEDIFSPLKEGEEAHWEVVERVLFLYAKTNTGIGYVQGMNEILGPLYYVFAQHPDPTWKAHAEADSFFCFTSLMTEIGDKFTKKLDTSQVGIGGSLKSLMTLLQKYDHTLHAHLVKCGIDPTYFAFRWITLLLSQEFLLPEVIRIWDSLFADDRRFSFLYCFSIAMMTTVREELLASDFSACVKLLQNFPINDTQRLFLKAVDVRKTLRRKH